MKNLFISLAVVAMFSLVACGPSAAEKEAQRIADSIKADSLMKDSIAKVEAAAKATADSIAKAQADSLMKDSIEKAAKKGKK